MKRTYAFPSFLLVLGLIYFNYYSSMPTGGKSASAPDTEFSTERALVPLREISKEPHYYGSKGHRDVRDFLENELITLGLETQIQEGYVLEQDSKHLNKPKNIIGRLKGSGNGKSLVLLSHYDSALIPSFGASDAGSGVVTILESLRAYLASGKIPKNDLIVIFTDCEEIGLDGAELFVNEHPWAKDIGFVMNFEARGSGGPSVMIIESNGGNTNLIDAFIKANPEFPVASSLMYSVYKILPNNTDSTTFREDGDIDSFFFAFIDDHFDYHTSNDTVENLDLKTLQHQGSYLLPLLHYFADADLEQLKSEDDSVYVNLPLVKMISYPFSWLLPMNIIAVAVLILLIFFGLKKERLSGKGIVKGFVPLLLSLVVCVVVGYFGWQLLLKIYPQYNEVQQGFKYNGHSYVGFFVFLSLAILFRFYRKFSKGERTTDIFIAPLILWILINIVVFVYLKGAGFFIIPVFFGLISLWVLIRQEKPNLLLMTLLTAPAIFIYEPLIRFFPIGLGSDHVFISCLFTVLLFALMIPVFRFYKRHRLLAFCCALTAIVFLMSAHLTSDFSETRQKPNSLIYYQDADSGDSSWLTYDLILDDWTKGYLGDTPQKISENIIKASDSKYHSGYTFASEAPKKEIQYFKTVLNTDSLNGNNRQVTFTIHPKIGANQIELFTQETARFQSLQFNGKNVPENSDGPKYANRETNKLLRFYIAENDSLEVSFAIDKDQVVTFEVLEYSFDLLNSAQFSVNKRPKNTMPKPFVVTDAIVVKKNLDLTSIRIKEQDSLTLIPLSHE